MVLNYEITKIKVLLEHTVWNRNTPLPAAHASVPFTTGPPAQKHNVLALIYYERNFLGCFVCSFLRV